MSVLCENYSLCTCFEDVCVRASHCLDYSPSLKMKYNCGQCLFTVLLISIIVVIKCWNIDMAKNKVNSFGLDQLPWERIYIYICIWKYIFWGKIKWCFYFNWIAWWMGILFVFLWDVILGVLFFSIESRLCTLKIKRTA